MKQSKAATGRSVLLQQVVDQVVRSVQNMDTKQVEFARDIYWASLAINWRKTKYQSFQKFIKKELNMAVSTAYRYRLVGKLIEQFKYSDSQCKKMVAAIGWSRFCIGMNLMRAKCSVRGFIQAYKGLKISTDYRRKNNEGGDSYFGFALPHEQSCKFTAKLMQYGMAESDGRRRGIRDAMIKFVDEEM